MKKKPPNEVEDTEKKKGLQSGEKDSTSGNETTTNEAKGREFRGKKSKGIEPEPQKKNPEKTPHPRRGKKKGVWSLLTRSSGRRNKRNQENKRCKIKVRGSEEIGPNSLGKNAGLHIRRNR